MWTPYVFHVSYLSFKNFVSSNMNQMKYIFVVSYMNKFVKNNFKSDEREMSNSGTPNIKKIELCLQDFPNSVKC